MKHSALLIKRKRRERESWGRWAKKKKHPSPSLHV